MWQRACDGFLHRFCAGLVTQGVGLRTSLLVLTISDTLFIGRRASFAMDIVPIGFCSEGGGNGVHCLVKDARISATPSAKGMYGDKTSKEGYI